MSITGTIDILLNLENFRNIDLFYQGLYYIRVISRFANCSLKPISVNQYASSLPPMHPHNLHPPNICHKEYSITSQTIYLQYTQENVNLNTLMHFQGTLPIKPGHVDQPIELTAELHFTDLQSSISLAKAQKAIELGFDQIEFTKVQTVKFKIANPVLGVNQHVPIFFDNMFGCVYRSSVHCTLTGF